MRKGRLGILALVTASALSLPFNMLSAPRFVSSSGVHGAHWDYSGAQAGPKKWGLLSNEFNICNEGRLQSPINLAGPTYARAAAALDIRYSPGPVTILNNGHTIQVSVAKDGCHAVVDGERFDLLQIHFHTPSENTIDGVRYPMEVHAVHKSKKDGKLKVMGIMVKEGKEHHPMAQAIWDHMPHTPHTEHTPADIAVYLADFFPKNRTHLRFAGSLTTPPCTEGVEWFVFSEPIEFSAEQIKRFRDVYPYNARPLQAQNGRPILLGHSS